MSAVRKRLHDDLERLLPEYRVTRGIATPDRISKPTIIIEQKSVDLSTGANGLIDLGVSVHVVTHFSGVTDRAEDDIDARVLEVLHALGQIRNVKVGLATKKMYAETNLSYEIETTTTARKKVTT